MDTVASTKENADFGGQIRGVNSVSGEKLHDFEIVCSASGGMNASSRGTNAPPVPTFIY